MDWQEEQRQRYLEQQAKREHLRQEETTRERERLKAQFAEQARREAEVTTERERLALNRRMLESEQQAMIAKHQREELQIENERRQAALQEATSKRKQRMITPQQGNPIEETFDEAFRRVFPGIELKRQYQIGPYRVDFAYEQGKVAIELDGYEYHHLKKHRNKDYTRQHEIEGMGWLFVRFTGSQIFGDVEACVRHAYKQIISRSG